MQIPKVGKVIGSKELLAHKGVPLAYAGGRTVVFLAEPFVIMLRTLRPTVTHVFEVNTHTGVQTAIQTRTRHVLTALFILAVNAVEKAVTARVDRQTVGQLSGTSVVSVGARVGVVQSDVSEISSTIQIDQSRWCDGSAEFHRVRHEIFTVNFV